LQPPWQLTETLLLQEKPQHDSHPDLICACLLQGEGQPPTAQLPHGGMLRKNSLYGRAAAQLYRMPAQSQGQIMNPPALLPASFPPPLAESNSSAGPLHPSPLQGKASHVCSLLATAGLQQENR